MIKNLIPDKTDSFFGLCYRQQLKDFESPGPYLEKEKYTTGFGDWEGVV